MEMGSIIHFELPTFLNLQGCGSVRSMPAVNTFNPANLSTDQWVQVEFIPFAQPEF